MPFGLERDPSVVMPDIDVPVHRFEKRPGPVDVEKLPHEGHARKTPRRWTDFISIGGMNIVSERVSEILSALCPSEVLLHRVSIRYAVRGGGEERVQYFIMKPLKVVPCIDLKASEGKVEQTPSGKSILLFPKTIRLVSGSVDGLNVWNPNEMVTETFVSDELALALRASAISGLRYRELPYSSAGSRDRG